MLDYIRQRTRSWAVRVILGLISLAFVLFFGTSGGGGSRQQAIAVVGDTDISLSEWQQARQRNEQYYRQQYGERLTPELLKALDIPGLTLSQLVDSAVLHAEAEQMGLRVPDEAVRLEIREIEAFRPEGQFSPAAYRRVLQRQGLNPASFEQSLRDQMLIEQLVDIIRRGVHVGDDEAFEAYRRDSDTVELSYLKIASSDLQDSVEIDEQGLTEFFEDSSEDYRQGDTVRVKYLAYTADNFVDASKVSDEDIEEYYELNREDEFTNEEKVSARHILKKFDSSDNDSKKAARIAIDAVAARLKAGEDFAKVATETSEDSSAASGGDLGEFGRGRMVKPFEETAFALAPGEISEVVESQFGFHIIQVYARAEAGERSLADVREEIIDKLAREKATDTAFDAASNDALDISEGTSLEMIAEERGLEIKHSGSLQDGKLVEGIGQAPKFIKAALALPKIGATSDVVHEGDTYYILALEERTDSYIPPLSEVRERVERAYRRERAAEKAREEAASVLENVKAGKSLADLASARGATLEDTRPFTRGGAFVPGLGNVAGLKEASFRASADGELLPRVFMHRGDAYVFVRKARTEADREDFDKAKEERIVALQQRGEQQAVDEFLRSLKGNVEISYNQNLLKQFLR